MNILICGVFDLIHVNHINFLRKSKNKGDKLFILINTDRFVSTYKRIPIINENDRLQMIENIKCVDVAFIDDNEYVTEEIINKYNINKVIQAINEPNTWSYYYHIPIQKNIMEFVPYNNGISTTDIIYNIETIDSTDNEKRYTRDNILKSEKLYGYGFQSPMNVEILENIIPNNNYLNILEIGSGLGGNCEYLFNKFKSNITGIDICKCMIDICNERNTNKSIQYILSDFKDFESSIKQDLILCRDVFLYLSTEQKYKYLQKIKTHMSSNSIFILIDYCRGNIMNQEFTEYCMQRSWHVIDVPFYKKLINDSGFMLVDSGSLLQDYIDYFKNIDNDIDLNVINNLSKKLYFLKNNNFEWHYFILKSVA